MPSPFTAELGFGHLRQGSPLLCEPCVQVRPRSYTSRPGIAGAILGSHREGMDLETQLKLLGRKHRNEMAQRIHPPIHERPGPPGLQGVHCHQTGKLRGHHFPRAAPGSELIWKATGESGEKTPGIPGSLRRQPMRPPDTASSPPRRGM